MPRDTCYRCGRPLEPNEPSWCYECKREYRRRYYLDKEQSDSTEYHRQYYQQNSDRIKANAREWNHKLREEVINAYGASCVCCGENHMEFLGLDHVEGRGAGAAHRRLIGEGNNIYRWARANDYPDTLQVLCHNCNMSLGFYGYCPHTEDN